MQQWLVLGAALALSSALGCSCSTTQSTDSGTGGDDAATGTDGGGGVDAASEGDAGTMSDGGTDAATLRNDANVDAAREDGGMCVDGLPDPHRPVAGQCLACRPASGTTSTTGMCHSDADCVDATMGTNGRCTYGRIGTFCSYDTCFADGDCATDEVCLCDAQNGGGNTCVPADCHVDADCGGGLGCSPTFGTCGHYSGFVGYRCHTAADTCTIDADCPAPAYCAYDEITAHWACSGIYLYLLSPSRP
jgi:hypothetical protein